MKINEITTKEMYKKINVEDLILVKKEESNVMTEAVFLCIRCDYKTHVKQEYPYTKQTPFECQNDVCGRKGPFKLLPEESVWKKIIHIEGYQVVDQENNGTEE